MEEAVCFIILSPQTIEGLCQMQRVIAGWQEYYRVCYRGEFYQAFVMGKDSIEIEDFKKREPGFRIELDRSWLDASIENIGILVVAYEKILEFIDEYYIPPIIHLVVEQENVLASLAQSQIFKMFADLGVEQIHIDIMKNPVRLEEDLDTMGESGKKKPFFEGESFIKIHHHYYEGKENGRC